MDTLVLRIPAAKAGKRSFDKTVELKEASGYALSYAQRELASKGCKLILVDQNERKTVVAVVNCIDECGDEKGRFDISFKSIKVKRHYLDVKFPKGYDAHKGCTLVNWNDYYLFS